MVHHYNKSYIAKVKCVDGSVREVSGTATIAVEEGVGNDLEYLLKCQILLVNFKPGEAVGADNVELLQHADVQADVATAVIGGTRYAILPTLAQNKPFVRYMHEVNISEVPFRNGKASLSLKQMFEQTLVKARVEQDAFYERFVEYFRDCNLNPKAREEAIDVNSRAKYTELFEAEVYTWETYQLGMSLMGFKYLTIESH